MSHLRISLALSALGVITSIGAAQSDRISMWSLGVPSTQAQFNPALEHVSKFQTFRVDFNVLKARYDRVPVQRFGKIATGHVVDIPTPDGRVMQFSIAEDPIMTPELQAQTTARTYRVQGITDPYMVGRLDTGVNGYNAFVRSPKGDWIVAPTRLGERNEYAVYFRRDNYRSRTGEFTCGTEEAAPQRTGIGQIIQAMSPGGDLKTYRLAMNATLEYTAFYGGVPAATNGVITSINRQNAVYEIDMAIRMTLVRNNPYTGSDPFSNNSGGTMLGQNQTVCDATPGNANYDIGHVFSTGGGGIAGLGVVGITGQKARGVTGSPSPIGDAFDIDYVAHEMGHQYGANHTFNSQAGSCAGGNRSAGNAYEPGSGSTIMGYAGICGVEDIQPNSNAYFHIRSMEEIWSWRNNPGSMGSSSANGNTPPTVNAGANFTIPQSTPYKLTATGSDANGDALTYCWEQYDLGTATTDPSQFSTGPLVRSRTPIASPVRFLPQLSTVINNTNDNWEKLPNTNRNMTFQVTARDNRAGGGAYAADTMVITVSGSAFQVTSPNTAVSWAGGSNQTVTWNVGGGSVAANVRILLSTDGGNSYGAGTTTVLLASTPNDGSQSVTLPNITSSTCRIIVEPVGNIFYDMSNVNFTITAANNPVPNLTSISPSTVTAGGANFVLTANGSNFVNGAFVRVNGSNRTTTFVNSGQLTATILSTDIATVGSATITVFNPAPGGGTSGGQTLTISPINVTPNSFSWIEGNGFTGNLASVTTSDDQYATAGPNHAVPRNAPNVIGEIQGAPGRSSASAASIAVELGASTSVLNMDIQAWSYSANDWVTVDTFAAPTADTIRNVNLTSPTNYLSGGPLRVRVRAFADPTGPRAWTIRIDRVSWSVSP